METKDLQIRLIAALRSAMYLKHSCLSQNHVIINDRLIARILHLSPSSFSRIATGVVLISTSNLRSLLKFAECYLPYDILIQLVDEWISTAPTSPEQQDLFKDAFYSDVLAI